MDKFFKLTENGTNVKREIVAGITTFMTMAYILIVNPTILSAAGMDSGAVFTATALSAVISTLIMGLYSRCEPPIISPIRGNSTSIARTVLPSSFIFI